MSQDVTNDSGWDVTFKQSTGQIVAEKPYAFLIFLMPYSCLYKDSGNYLPNGSDAQLLFRVVLVYEKVILTGLIKPFLLYIIEYCITYSCT